MNKITRSNYHKIRNTLIDKGVKSHKKFNISISTAYIILRNNSFVKYKQYLESKKTKPIKLNLDTFEDIRVDESSHINWDIALVVVVLVILLGLGYAMVRISL